MNAFWDKFKKRCKRDLKHVLMGRTNNEEFQLKMHEKEIKSRKTLSEAQSGFNKWLFSLKKSKYSNHKNYEIMKSSADPNRVIWAHISELSAKPKTAIRSPRNVDLKF